MDNKNLSESGTGRGAWVFRIIFWFLAVLFFYSELRRLINLGTTLLPIALEQTWSELPIEKVYIFVLTLLNLVGVLALAILVIYFIAPFFFPTRNLEERWQAVRRFLAFLVGWQVPVVRVKDGKTVSAMPEFAPVRGGVIINDLCSAVVLERYWSPLIPVLEGLFYRLFSPHREAGSAFRYPTARVIGPGIGFARWGFLSWSERLRGVVNLRRQFRINLNVRACTSDGIEVEAHVISIFSLGQLPMVLKVAYWSDQPDQPVNRAPETLRVLQLGPSQDDPSLFEITRVDDFLDDADKQAIHTYAMQFFMERKFSEPIPLAPAERHKDYAPFLVDDDRILDAIYSQGREIGSRKLVDWTELPTMVGSELFRSMISQVTYDSLFVPDDPKNFPLGQSIKPEFFQRMRYMGVMDFQFIHPKNGYQLSKKQPIIPQVCHISPVQRLPCPTDPRFRKELRERGIKLIVGTFSSDVRPVNQAIRQQRVDNWRSRWQQKAELARADQDLEVSRILNRARADKQREMIFELSKILQMSTFSDDALVLRIFQALEDVATEPATRRFLPHDTIEMLQNLRLWLLPDEMIAGMYRDGTSPPIPRT